MSDVVTWKIDNADHATGTVRSIASAAEAGDVVVLSLEGQQVSLVVVDVRPAPRAAVPPIGLEAFGRNSVGGRG